VANFTNILFAAFLQISFFFNYEHKKCAKHFRKKLVKLTPVHVSVHFCCFFDERFFVAGPKSFLRAAIHTG